jgi:hypothetical protein
MYTPHDVDALERAFVRALERHQEKVDSARRFRLIDQLFNVANFLVVVTLLYATITM